MHDGHQVILKAPLEHVVLRWAKNGNIKYSIFINPFPNDKI